MCLERNNIIHISANKLTLVPANIVLSIFVPLPTPTTERNEDSVSKTLLAPPRGGVGGGGKNTPISTVDYGGRAAINNSYF